MIIFPVAFFRILSIFPDFCNQNFSEDFFLGLIGIFLYFLGLFEDLSKIFPNPNLWSILSIFPDLAWKKEGYRVPCFGRFFDYAYGVVS